MGFSSSFVLIQKKKKQEEKIKATSPGLLRKGRSIIRQGASLLAFCSGFALPSALLVCYLLVIRYCFLAVSDKYYIHSENDSEVRTKHCDD